MAEDLKPPGLRDPSRRVVSNKVMQDEGVFLKYSCETGGKVTECSLLVKPQGGNPLHYHQTFTETFTAVSGRLGVQVNDDTLYLDPPSPDFQTQESNGATSTFTVPRTVPHRFFNPSTTDDVRCSVRIAPGSPGFEKSIYIAYGLANDGLCDNAGLPKSFLHLCIIAGLGDINIAGGWKAKLVNVVSKIGQWWARVSGEEDRLLQKYYAV